MYTLYYRYFLLILLTLLFKQACFAGLPTQVDGQPLPSLAPMLEKATPAVVNIATRTHIRVQENPLLNDPFFRFFFRDFPSPRMRKREEQSLGSGVVVDTNKGYVITNYHVIDKADEITVTLRDGRKFEAKLIGGDSETDVALVQIKADKLTALPLANSDELRVGDFVVAIGNPFGLGQTVTSGIVSALGRSGLGIEGYEDFIQTDASINPGNSGGALVNLRGELVGINTAILAPSGGNVGIGFAIPTNMTSKIVKHLVDFGEVRRGSLGIHVQDLTPDLAVAFSLEGKKGAVVVEVDEDSPADKAGLKTSDVVIAINGESVENSMDARNRVGLLRIGEKVDIKILRQGEEKTLQAEVAKDTIDGDEISRYFKGTELKNSKDGIEVRSIKKDSMAWKFGFRKGDTIIGVNRMQVHSIEDLKERVNRRTVSFQIKRDDNILNIWLQ